MSLVGFESDLDAVELLFASLSLQAVSAMAQTRVPSYDTPRAFRHSFLIGFASRVGRRLKDARRDATVEAMSTTPGASLVLISRQDQVDAAFAEAYPEVETRRTSATGTGGNAGWAAGSRADLGQGRVGGARRALQR